jgi:hypothetical protein
LCNFSVKLRLLTGYKIWLRASLVSDEGFLVNIARHDITKTIRYVNLDKKSLLMFEEWQGVAKLSDFICEAVLAKSVHIKVPLICIRIEPTI